MCVLRISYLGKQDINEAFDVAILKVTHITSLLDPLNVNRQARTLTGQELAEK